MDRIRFTKEQQRLLQKYKDKNIKKARGKVKIGRIYIFSYPVAKVAKYWDAYPLSLIIHQDNKYMLGLSLHYLPPKTRKFFIQKILVKNYKTLKKDGNVILPYGDIANVANLWYREGIAIIRKYIKSRVKSNMAEIPYTEWLNIISGDGAKWINTTASEIYKITKKDIKKAYEKNKIGNKNKPSKVKPKGKEKIERQKMKGKPKKRKNK